MQCYGERNKVDSEWRATLLGVLSIKQTPTGERLKGEWIHIVGPSCFLSLEHIQHEVSTDSV